MMHTMQHASKLNWRLHGLLPCRRHPCSYGVSLHVKGNKKYFKICCLMPGSNWRPSVCETDVITYYTNETCCDIWLNLTSSYAYKNEMQC